MNNTVNNQDDDPDPITYEVLLNHFQIQKKVAELMIGVLVTVQEQREELELLRAHYVKSLERII